VEPNSADALPPAGEDGVGHRVFGWVEPDQDSDASQIYGHPEDAARNWTADMLVAKGLGYKEFVAPTMAEDVCWLDFFLKGCEQVPKCPELVTHLSFTRFRTDCADYDGNVSSVPYRDDLGYIASFGRLQEKYNARGFKIAGLILTMLGCKRADGAAAPANETVPYLDALLRNTIGKVREGDSFIIDSISNSAYSRYIGFSGPDAVEGAFYSPGTCGWQDPGEGASVGNASVRAIRSLTSMAWMDMAEAEEVNESAREAYFATCTSIKDIPQDGWEPAWNYAVG